MGVRAVDEGLEGELLSFMLGLYEKHRSGIMPGNRKIIARIAGASLTGNLAARKRGRTR